MRVREFEFTEEDRERASTLSERVLVALRTGPKLSSELTRITHRFSASIKILREMGYGIRVERLDNSNFLHHLESYTPLVEVTDVMKSAYYQTEHWINKRLERLEIDEFRCCHCRSTQSLQVHHWVYELFAESIEDLVTLCNTCHERIHEYDCVKLHFPKFVPIDIADRIAVIGGAPCQRENTT